jgi:hypothetical protein
MAVCFALLDPRTLVVSDVQASTPATGQPDVTRANIAIAAAVNVLAQVKNINVAPDGSFALTSIAISGPYQAFGGAGWYARNPGGFIADTLHAGPYSDEAGCLADLPRTKAAMARFRRINDDSLGCAAYNSEHDVEMPTQ